MCAWFDALDQTHFRSSTRVVSPRFGYPPVRAPRHGEAFCRWCAALLSTFYPLTISESSSGVTGSLAPTHADLLPPLKRFRDSYSSETSMEEDTEIDTTKTEEEFEASAGKDSSYSSGTRDGTVRIVEIETVQRRLEADQLIASGERARMTERIEGLRTMTNTRSRMTPAIIEEMINRRVAEALEAHEVNRNLGLENGNGNGGNGNENGKNENGNGQGGNGNGDGRGDRPVARECTYQDFMKCQPLNFKRTKGVFGLIRWCEKMETMFYISNCPKRYRVKFATGTLLDSALTW
nr:putative reverse transcriptase domain-containing protein [Tanacetum cinerariifolium]